jgi:hypothetical protein
MPFSSVGGDTAFTKNANLFAFMKVAFPTPCKTGSGQENTVTYLFFKGFPCN